MSEPIVRIAARGDGVTASGRHVPFAVPATCCSTTERSSPGQATRFRHAAISPNAAGASFSI